MSASLPASGNFRKRADWRSVEALYGQFTSILSNGERMPPEVAGALATSLGRVLAFYEDSEQLFLNDLLALWSEIDHRGGSESEKFRGLYFDKRLDSHPEYKFPPDLGIRRRPRPFESAVETTRRLIDLNGVRQAFSEIPTAAILGGSLSYGRFYNVTGNASEFGSKSSDTDLLLVLENYDDLLKVAERLKSVPGVEKESLRLLASRAELFSTIRRDHHHCVFSHKLRFWGNAPDPILGPNDISANYALSLHIFSLDEFDYMTLKDGAILGSDSKSGLFEREIHDYRDTPPGPAGAYDNKSFSGIPLGKHNLEPVKVKLGHITNVQTCLIKENRFCPGLHQNLVLPQFEKRWRATL
jgi:hypothetical protein